MKLIIKKARRAFNRTKIPGARWVINQYIGCQHACKYCYAKFMCKWYDYGKWGSWVVARENLPELVKEKKIEGKVYMSSVSDAYQPIERKLKLTRRVLESMNKKTNLSILTKSNLVVRDIDLFKEFDNISVGITVNGFDDEIKKQIEPFSPSMAKRINALKILHESGIQNYAFVSPVIPELSDLERIIKETKDFVDYYWFEFLNLKASGYEFQKWLKQNYPRSLKTLKDGSRINQEVKALNNLSVEMGINVRGIYAHYPFRSRRC